LNHALERSLQHVAGDKLDVLFHKIESRFEFREQFEETVAEPTQWRREPTCQLRQGDLKLLTIVGINHTEHGLGLRQIEPACQKRAQRKLAWASNSSADGAQGAQCGFEKWW
jgi:hypothetical protein